jgi:hypothetical protein
MTKIIFIYLVATFAGNTFEFSEAQQKEKALKYVARVEQCGKPQQPKSFYSAIPHVGDTIQYSPDKWAVVRSYDWADKNDLNLY